MGVFDFWAGVGKSLMDRLLPKPPAPVIPPISTDPSSAAVSLSSPAGASGSVVDFSKLDRANALPFTHLIVHHSATADGRLNDWEAIRKYHMSYRVDYTPVTKEAYEAALAASKPHCEGPDVDIGYNLGVEEENGQVIIKLGRRLSIPGAHCKQQNMNRISIGMCVVGNFDKAPPDKAHWDKAVAVAKAVIKEFNIPVANVRGHRDFAPKTCPGNCFQMDRFRTELVA